MANIGDFEGMLIFGSERNPPQTGWMPFVEICLRYGRLSEANQFIKLIKVMWKRYSGIPHSIVPLGSL